MAWGQLGMLIACLILAATIIFVVFDSFDANK